MDQLRNRVYTPALEESSAIPVFLRLSRAIVRDVRSGRLLPGARLPGSRELALRLRVHRNTVLAAYAELEQEGWLTAKWQVAETGRRAKFYTLSPAGRRALEQEAANWERLAAAISRVVRLKEV